MRRKKSELEKFNLYYENLPTDDLLKKISDHTKSAKLKAIDSGWVAQIRVRLGNDSKRTELAFVDTNPNGALKKLDKRMREMGLYDL